MKLVDKHALISELLAHGRAEHHVIDMQKWYVDYLDPKTAADLIKNIPEFTASLPSSVPTHYWAVPMEDYSMSIQELCAENAYSFQKPDGSQISPRLKTEDSLYRYRDKVSASLVEDSDRKLMIFSGINRNACVLASARDANALGHVAIVIADLTADSKTASRCFNQTAGSVYSDKEKQAMTEGVLYKMRTEVEEMLGIKGVKPSPRVSVSAQVPDYSAVP